MVNFEFSELLDQEGKVVLLSTKILVFSQLNRVCMLALLGILIFVQNFSPLRDVLNFRCGSGGGGDLYYWHLNFL